MNPWRKSSRSFSNGNCAEVSAWRKSAGSGNGATSNCAEIGAWRVPLASDGGACAEVGTGEAVVGVRDTKQAHLGEARTVLEFTSGAWEQFLAQLRQEA